MGAAAAAALAAQRAGAGPLRRCWASGAAGAASGSAGGAAGGAAGPPGGMAAGPAGAKRRRRPLARIEQERLDGARARERAARQARRQAKAVPRPLHEARVANKTGGEERYALPEAKDVRGWDIDPPTWGVVRWPPPRFFLQANPDFRKVLRQAKKYEEENRVLEAVQPDPRIGNDLEPNKIGLEKLRVDLLRDLCEVWGVKTGKGKSRLKKVEMVEILAHRMQRRAKELRQEKARREEEGIPEEPVPAMISRAQSGRRSVGNPPREEAERKRLRDLSAKLQRPVVAPARRKRSMPCDAIRLLPPERMCQVLSKAHAADVCSLDVRSQADFCEMMVVATGVSPEHLQTLAGALLDELREGAKKLQVWPTPRPVKDGKPGADWVVVDFGAVVVHLFLEEARESYDLEGLWTEAGGGNVQWLDARGRPRAAGRRGLGATGAR